MLENTEEAIKTMKDPEKLVTHTGYTIRGKPKPKTKYNICFAPLCDSKHK
jgi:hypothetical protein